MTKILAFAGSTRVASLNKRIVHIASEGARAAGAEVTVIDLRDFPLPLFDEDLETADGLPRHAKRFKELLKEHDGFLIASPEYNSSISGVLKNAIDWASRVETKDEPALVCFRGKTAALMSASPGGLGGLRGLVHLRSILGNIGVLVLADQIALPKAHELFDEQGEFKDAKKQNQLEGLGRSLAEIAGKLK